MSKLARVIKKISASKNPTKITMSRSFANELKEEMVETGVVNQHYIDGRMTVLGVPWEICSKVRGFEVNEGGKGKCLSFVLVSETDYYLGNTYIYQGELYPAIGSLQEAKRYKSRARAERSVEALNRKVGHMFVVVEEKDGRNTIDG